MAGWDGKEKPVWDIRASLFTLSLGELFQVASNVGPAAGQEQPQFDEGDQERCFENVSSFMYSKHLLESKDSGMVQLLLLKDFIDNLIANRVVMSISDGRKDGAANTTQTITQTG